MQTAWRRKRRFWQAACEHVHATDESRVPSANHLSCPISDGFPMRRVAEALLGEGLTFRISAPINHDTQRPAQSEKDCSHLGGGLGGGRKARFCESCYPRPQNRPR